MQRFRRKIKIKIHDVVVSLRHLLCTHSDQNWINQGGRHLRHTAQWLGPPPSGASPPSRELRSVPSGVFLNDPPERASASGGQKKCWRRNCCWLTFLSTTPPPIETMPNPCQWTSMGGCLGLGKKEATAGRIPACCWVDSLAPPHGVGRPRL